MKFSIFIQIIIRKEFLVLLLLYLIELSMYVRYGLQEDSEVVTHHTIALAS